MIQGVRYHVPGKDPGKGRNYDVSATAKGFVANVEGIAVKLDGKAVQEALARFDKTKQVQIIMPPAPAKAPEAPAEPGNTASGPGSPDKPGEGEGEKKRGIIDRILRG